MHPWVDPSRPRKMLKKKKRKKRKGEKKNTPGLNLGPTKHFFLFFFLHCKSCLQVTKKKKNLGNIFQDNHYLWNITKSVMQFPNKEVCIISHISSLMVLLIIMATVTRKLAENTVNGSLSSH